jgi:CheY-like chemotaxis protein
MRPASEVKVLVVEDDPYFTRILQKRLITEGFQVFTAGDGRAGMKAIVQHEPDLVISDWMMPEVDGLELCQSVKTGLREAAPYFILLTAKGEVNDKLLARRSWRRAGAVPRGPPEPGLGVWKLSSPGRRRRSLARRRGVRARAAPCAGHPIGVPGVRGARSGSGRRRGLSGGGPPGSRRPTPGDRLSRAG